MTENECIRSTILSVEFDIEFVRVSVYVLRLDGFLIGEVTWIHPGLLEHLCNP